MAGRGDIQAGKAFVALYTKDAGLLSGLKAGMGTVAKGIGAAAVGIGALGGVAAAGIGAALTHFASLGSELNDMSARTGVAAGSLAELKFAAEQSGAGLEDVETAMKKFVKGGHDIKQFDSMAASIAAIQDPSERSRKALEMFGKGGTKLLPMFAELKSLRNEAQSLGLAPSDEDVAMADKLGDSFDKIKSVMGASLFKLGAAFAPIIQPMLEGAAKLIGLFNRWALQNNIVVDTLKSIGDSLSGGEWGLAADIAIKSVQVAMLKGLNVIASLFGETFETLFGSIATDLIEGNFAGAWDTVMKGVAAGWDAVALGFVQVFSEVINQLSGMWATFQNGMVATLHGLSIGARIQGQGVLADQLQGAANSLMSGAGGAGDAVTAGITVGQSAAKAFADSMAERSTRSAVAFGGKLNAGEGKTNAEIAALMMELKELRARAAAAKKADPAAGGVGGDFAAKVAVSSAASAGGAMALASSGSGGSVAKQTLSEIKQMRRDNAEHARLMRANSVLRAV